MASEKKNSYFEEWQIDCSRGVLDAIIDIGRDLESLDNTSGVQTIIDCVNARIGTPDGLVLPAEYQKYFKKYSKNEGRLNGYTHTLRFLCYADFGNGSIKALVDISRYMRSCYGDDNTMEDGGMETLEDAIGDMIESPPPKDERYSQITGYLNMMRAIYHLAHIKGI